MKVTAGIYRGRLSFEEGFTRIPNGWLRDSRLGFRAKGLLAYLLSHEVGYTITLGQIERETGDGRHAIRSAMDDLIEAGYLQKERTHDERGWNAGLAYYLSDPHPESENPTLENPTLENHTAYREENLIEKTTKREVLVQTPFERLFAEFWNEYPRKVRKDSARKAFEKAVEKIDAHDLIVAARRLALDPNLPDKEFIPHPATWLNGGGWEDEPYPERKLSAEEVKERNRISRELKAAKEREEREQARLERERLRLEAEANRPALCEHDRVKVICPTCSPIKVSKSN